VASHITRRGILGLGAVAGMSIVVGRPALASAPPRVLRLRNIHTGESFAATYWADGAYVPDALGEIRRVLRDHRSGETHEISPRLLDLLADLRAGLDTVEPFEVISGYRSPKTNGLMRKAKHGVAKRSLHMTGEAIDIRLPGRDLARLNKAALSLGRGGVGFYPKSDFVHVDVGPVRRWGQPRLA
jgi:uncharacterized protein YcbK (DUF882 family)